MKPDHIFDVIPNNATPQDQVRASRVARHLDWMYQRPLTDGDAFFACLELIVRLWALQEWHARVWGPDGIAWKWNAPQ